jgi:hypothetical protein
MYDPSDLNQIEDPVSKLRWIDNGENNKEKLRTNPSEDDLCLKMTVDPILAH